MSPMVVMRSYLRLRPLGRKQIDLPLGQSRSLRSPFTAVPWK
jgi:hypothetical protein